MERAWEWVEHFHRKKANDKMAADLNFAVFVFISRGYKDRNKTAKVFTLKTALKEESLLYIFFNKETISSRIVNFLVEFTHS